MAMADKDLIKPSIYALIVGFIVSLIGIIPIAGVGFLMGVGVGVSLAEAWHVRLDMQSVTIDGDVLNVREDTGLDSFLLELQYRFGARGTQAQPVPAK
jgi:hypothetical protein